MNDFPIFMVPNVVDRNSGGRVPGTFFSVLQRMTFCQDNALTPSWMDQGSA